jgi:hypothetical protein
MICVGPTECLWYPFGDVRIPLAESTKDASTVLKTTSPPHPSLRHSLCLRFIIAALMIKAMQDGWKIPTPGQQADEKGARNENWEAETIINQLIEQNLGWKHPLYLLPAKAGAIVSQSWLAPQDHHSETGHTSRCRPASDPCNHFARTRPSCATIVRKQQARGPRPIEDRRGGYTPPHGC